MWDTILARHPDPFRAHPRNQFEHRIERLLQRKSAISEAEAFVEASQLLGMLEDGHSWISIDDDSALYSKALPLRFWMFSDGIRVRATSPEVADLLGARLVAIAGVPVARSWDQVLTAVGGGGQMAIKRAQIYLAIPEFMHAVGLAADNASIDFELELTDGKRIHKSLAAEQYENYSAIWNTADKWAIPDHWIVPEDAGKAPWYARRNEAFWSSYESKTRTVYAAFNLATSDPEHPWNPSKDSFRPFLNRLFERVDKNDVDTLVIDLRNNNGGNSALWQPLVHHIIRTQKLYIPGHLYVLTSRLTESAAVAWAARIESNAPALFVGEATASPPNFFNDPDGPRRQVFHFPGSAINFRVANMMEQWSDARDSRHAIFPDIPAPSSWTDFSAGRDPALREVSEISDADHYFTDGSRESLLPYPWKNFERISQLEATIRASH